MVCLLARFGWFLDLRTEMSLLACKQSKVFLSVRRQRRITNHTDGCLFRSSDWYTMLPEAEIMRLVCGLSFCWEDDYTCGASAVLCGQTSVAANATFYWVKKIDF